MQFDYTNFGYLSDYYFYINFNISPQKNKKEMKQFLNILYKYNFIDRKKLDDISSAELSMFDSKHNYKSDYFYKVNKRYINKNELRHKINQIYLYERMLKNSNERTNKR